MGTRVVFSDKKTRKGYDSIRDISLKRSLDSAFKQLKQDPSVGISLEKYRIPKELKSKGYDNVWKYNLPGAWRLLYSIKTDRIIVFAIILDWCTHKEYQRKYSGKKRRQSVLMYQKELKRTINIIKAFPENKKIEKIIKIPKFRR